VVEGINLCTHYVRLIYQRYIAVIVAFLEVVQFPEHPVTHCGVLREHVRCFADLEVLTVSVICVGGVGCS
jgi:hypothetical protein